MRVFTTVELIVIGLGILAGLTCFVWAYCEWRRDKVKEQLLRNIEDMFK